ncbi:hypothetical protein Tco_1427824 [Tanacetum coccineum]
MSGAPVRYSPSANYLLLTENEPDVFLSQNVSKKEGITKIVDVQASWAERKPRVQIEGNSVRTDSSTETMVDDILVVGSDMAEFNKPKWVLIFVEDSWKEEPCRNVHQFGDEREVKVMCSFNWPLSELITKDGFLPERGYSQFNDVSLGYLVSKVS